MLEGTKNSLGYGALLAGALLLGSGILAGDFSRRLKSGDQSLDEAAQQKIRASMYAYAKQLESSDNPRDLAVSAFLQVSNHPDQKLTETLSVSKESIALLKKAIESGPNDPTLAWLEAMDCGWMNTACDKKAALARLVKLEPDNAAVDFLLFNEAHIAGNSTAAWQALASGGNKTDFTLPLDAISKMYLDSLQGWNSPVVIDARGYFGKNAKDLSPLTQDELRKAAAFGYGLAFALPAFQYYSEYCKPAPTDPAQLEACQKFTRNMATDNDVLARNIATHIGVAVFTQSPEKEAWLARREQSVWQSLQYSKLLQSIPDIDRKNLRAWPGTSELDRRITLLTENNIPLSPPDGWTSPKAR